MNYTTAEKKFLAVVFALEKILYTCLGPKLLFSLIILRFVT